MKVKTFVFALIVLVIVLLLPYARVEYLTLRYGEDFEGLEQQTNMLERTDFHKVIRYSDTRAIVLYVSSTSKDEITFEKDSNGLWELKVWKTIWSKTGSASELYWPFYMSR